MNINKVINLLCSIDDYITNLHEVDLTELISRVTPHKGYFLLSSDVLSIMDNDLGVDLLTLETIAPAILTDEEGFLPNAKKSLENNDIRVVRGEEEDIYRYYLICRRFTFGVGFS